MVENSAPWPVASSGYAGTLYTVENMVENSAPWPVASGQWPVASDSVGKEPAVIGKPRKEAGS